MTLGTQEGRQPRAVADLLPVVPVAVNSGPLYRSFVKRPGQITYRFGAAVEPGLPRAEVEARVREAINALNR